MSDLREALGRNAEVFEPTWEESVLFADAARKTLDPITDEEVEQVAFEFCMHGDDQWEDENGFIHGCDDCRALTPGALEAFMRGRFGDA